jgi:protease I
MDEREEVVMSRIAVVIGPGYEDSEFRVPYDRLVAAGHEVKVLGSEPGETVEGKRGEDRVRVEASPADAGPADFDALLLPGGHAPDKLRTDADVVRFVRDFCQSGKPVAAICHGPQLLIEADAVKGRRMTSYASIKTDLRNAGAEWVDEEVVEDGTLITSRAPGDLDAFTKALLDRL